MRRSIIAAALVLSACTTTTEHMASSPPFQVVHSQRARAIVADCLLNRVTSDGAIPDREIGPSETTIAFNGPGIARKPALYLFTIRDDGTGSTIEVRRYAGMSLAAAETCF